MTDKFEYKGKWKLPNDKNWINGTLTFDPEFGNKLEVFGSFNISMIDRESKEIVLGKTTEGPVTIIDCWYRGTKTVHGQVTIGSYKPMMIIVGHHFYNLSDINFKEVKFGAFNLFQWFDVTGISSELDDYPKSYDIKYEKAPNIDFCLGENCQGEISFISPISIGGKYNDVSLKEDTSVILKYDKQKHFQEILSSISKIIDFTTLFSYEQSYPAFIVFSDDEYIRENYRSIQVKKELFFYYENSNYNKNLKLKNIGQHLVRYITIKDKFPKILENWCKLYDTSDEVIYLILKYFKTKYKFSSEKFVDVIKALESYHRIHYNNERLPGDKFKALVSAILNQTDLNDDDSTWLEQRLMGNEPNLKTRIQELTEKNPTNFLEKKVEKLNKFCRQTTDSRNYYTHFDPKKKKRAMEGRALADLTRVNRAIIVSSLLNDIGIDSEFYEDGLNYNMG